jgi:pilus assembly protein Flp/PilA
MLNLLRLLLNNRRGATAVEYGLIVALIALAASAAIALFADAAIDMWEYIKTNALDNL